jgi:hypothetical protein
MWCGEGSGLIRAGPPPKMGVERGASERRIPRCHLSSEEKVLAQTYWPTGQHPVSPDAPLLPRSSLAENKLPRTLGTRRLPGVSFCDNARPQQTPWVWWS